MDLTLRAWVEKTVYAVETRWLSGKEKFRVQRRQKAMWYWQSSGAWKDSSQLSSLKKV